jgi:hypothetical protein
MSKLEPNVIASLWPKAGRSKGCPEFISTPPGWTSARMR